MIIVFKSLISSLVFVGLSVGMGLAQTPQMPLPEVLSADASPEQVRDEVMAVHDIICGDINYAAQILTKTGTLANAIPVVVEMTGMQPAEIESMEAAVCRSDLSGMTFEELRANNRKAVWLLDVHLTALDKIIEQ